MKLLQPCAMMAVIVLLSQVGVRADFLAPEPAPTPAAPPTQNASPTTGGSTTAGPASHSQPVSLPGATPTTPNSTPSRPAPPPSKEYDNTDPAWTWSQMGTYPNPNLYHKSGNAGGPGSYGVFSFYGTGIQISGMSGPEIMVNGSSHSMGSAVVFIDGKQIATTPLTGTDFNYRQTVFKVDGLPLADHILHVEPNDGWIVVNYVTVLNTPPQPAQTDTTQDAAETSVSGPTYRLVPQGTSELCMEVAPGPLKGAGIQLGEIGSSSRQAWTLNPLPNNKFTLSPAGHPELVLWVIPPSPGGKLSQDFLWPYTASPNEILTVTEMQANPYECTFVGQGDDMTVGVWHDGFSDGAPVVGDVLTFVYGQKWQVQRLSN